MIIHMCRNDHSIFCEYNTKSDFIQNSSKILDKRIKESNQHYDWRIFINSKLMMCRDEQLYRWLTASEIFDMLLHLVCKTQMFLFF